MSLEVGTTASTSSTSSASSSSGVGPIPVSSNEESLFSSLHQIISKCLASLASIEPEGTEGKEDLQQAKNRVCENFTLLYLGHVEAICKDLKKEVDSGEDLSSLARDGYLTSINNANGKQAALDKEIEELDKIFKEDLRTIQTIFSQEAAESFKKLVTAEIDTRKEEMKKYSYEKTDKLVEKALTEFYNSNLDSHPNLHPDFGGSHQKEIAQHYSQDIVDFLDKNSEMDTQYKDALFECSAKLQEAFCFEIMRKSSDKKSKNSSLADHAKTMEIKIKNLKVGESCLFLGGTETHAVIYEVIRKSKDSCEFTIINTGADEKNAKDRKPDNISRFFMSDTEYCHKSYIVNTATLDSNFLLKLLQSQGKRIPMEDVLKEIDQHFKTKPQLGRVHHFQERGSCSAKSAASWVKGELIRKLGEKKGTALYLQLKHYRAEKSYGAILKLEKEVPKAHFQNAYSTRTYKKKKTPYAKKEVLFKVPATESQLNKCLIEMHSTAAQVINTWGEKAQKAKGDL